MPSAERDAIKQFKYGLFMLLHVECQAHFATYFNDKLRDVYEELGVGSTSMMGQFEIPQTFEEEDVSMQERITRSVTLDTDSNASAFENVFVLAAESVEREHDFEMEVREKREAEK